MGAIVKYIEFAGSLLNWGGLNALLGATGFITNHVPGTVLKGISNLVRTKLGAELTKDQIKGLLSIVSLTRKTMNTMVINDNGEDIRIEASAEDSEYTNDDLKVPDSMNIIVLAGGLSAERNISLRTGSRIADALKEAGHRVILLDSYLGCSAEDSILNSAFDHCEELSIQPVVSESMLPDLWAVRKRRSGKDDGLLGPNVIRLCRMADMVFIGLHSAYGENGRLQAVLDINGIDYTGCGYEESTIAMDKNVSKKLFRYADVSTPDWGCVEKGQNTDELPGGVEFPVVVKPLRGGAGIGVTMASDQAAYKAALTEAFKWENSVLVEEYIFGREFSVGILDGEALPVIEISTPSGFYNFNSRFLSGEAVISCPAALDEATAARLKEEAKKAAVALGVDCYCSVDFIMSAAGDIYCLECDSLPRLTENSLYSREAEAAGISYPEMCRKIIEASVKQKATN